MKPISCPICHTQFTLDAVVMDEAQRELWRLILGLPNDLQGAVVSYIALFRSEKGGLSNARALSLTKEVLALHANQDVLTQALNNTVSGILTNRKNAVEGSNRPLKNHNYLKSVIASMPVSQELTSAVVTQHGGHSHPASKTGLGMRLLVNRK